MLLAIRIQKSIPIPVGIIALLGLFLSCRPEPRTGPDNLILIMADDMGYECLSVHGSLSYQTPHIDQLALDGMVFTHCYAQPLCTPTRVQLMTGRYNFRNYRQFGYLDLNQKTFAHDLQEAGYATCMTGKWQLDGGIEAPHQAGFDEYCLWQIYNHIAGKDERGSRYADPRYYINGDLYDDQTLKYGPDVFTDFALRFMDKHQHEPFMIYYPMVLPHDPFCPTPDSDMWATNRFDRDTSYFRDMVSYTDQLVYAFRRKIEELALEDCTYLIFTGDNGTSRSIVTQTVNGPVRGGKSLTHEYGIHVPLVVYAPGRVRAGQQSSALIDFTDFFPTLLEAAGTSADENYQLDGISFLPILSGEREQLRDFVYGYYWHRGRNPLIVQEYIRDHQYKYYRDGRIFDPVSDPEEMHPLEGPYADELRKRYEQKINLVRPTAD